MTQSSTQQLMPQLSSCAVLLLCAALSLLIHTSHANYFYIPGHQANLVPNNISSVVESVIVTQDNKQRYFSNFAAASNNITVGTILNSEISNLVEYCTHNTYAHTENTFLAVMNGCYMHFLPDNNYLKMLRHFALWVLTWVNGWIFSRILMLLIVSSGFLFGFYAKERVTRPLVVRRAFYLLEWGYLLLRLSTLLAFSVWALSPVRQPAPCACYYAGETTSFTDLDQTIVMEWKAPFQEVLGNAWNFPAVNTLVSITIALYLTERFNILIGVVLGLLLPVLEIAAGLASVGQVMPAVVLGLAIYFYQRFTPPIFRFADIALNILAGALGILLPKQFPIYRFVPYDFIDVFLEAQILQMFVIAVWLTQFTPPFLKFILLRRPQSYTIVDLEFFPYDLLPNVDLPDTATDGYRESDVFDELDQKQSLTSRIGQSMFTVLWDKRLIMIGIFLVTFTLLGLTNILSFWTRKLYFGWIK